MKSKELSNHLMVSLFINHVSKASMGICKMPGEVTWK
jgi:hypothetical protein